LFRTNSTIAGIQKNATENTDNSWESIDLQECMKRYNDKRKIVDSYRHVIMLVRHLDGSPVAGWTRKQILRNTTGFDDTGSMNVLWNYQTFMRVTPTSEKFWTLGSPFEHLDFRNIAGTDEDRSNNHWPENGLNSSSGELTPYPFKDYHTDQEFKVHHCLSERVQSRCELTIQNELLLIVCIMCSFKSLLCVSVLLILGCQNHEDRLITLGDAIATFITKPEDGTSGMCTLDTHDMKLRPRSELCAVYENIGLASPWPRKRRHGVGKCIPWVIWILSYLLLGVSPFIAGGSLVLALTNYPLYVPLAVPHTPGCNLKPAFLENIPISDTISAMASFPPMGHGSRQSKTRSFLNS
jgi:hypothetical protein